MSDERKNLKEEQLEDGTSFSLFGLPASAAEVKSSVTSDFGTSVAKSVGGLSALSPSSLSFEPSSVRTGLEPPVLQKGTPRPHGKPSSKKTRDLAESSFRSSSARSVWHITDKSLPILPEFHPVERTAVFVPHTAAPIVASRVVEILKEMSISATFDETKAKAKCRTNDNVEFRIRLYRGRNRFGHGVIVEVQRRYGFSVGFHTDVVAILDAAQGKEIRPRSPLPENIIPIVSDSEGSVHEEDYETASIGGKRKISPTSIQLASYMIKKSRNIDAHFTALESLSSLTDPTKVGHEASLRVSREIFISEDRIVLDTVVSILKAVHASSAPQKSLGWIDDTDSLCTVAMTLLSNAISNLSHSSQASDLHVFDHQRRLLHDEIVPVLLKAIRKAEFNPGIAALACRTLQPVIVRGNRRMASVALEGDALGALRTARRVGDARHSSLMLWADCCIDVLTEKSR